MCLPPPLSPNFFPLSLASCSKIAYSFWGMQKDVFIWGLWAKSKKHRNILQPGEVIPLKKFLLESMNIALVGWVQPISSICFLMFHSLTPLTRPLTTYQHWLGLLSLMKYLLQFCFVFPSSFQNSGNQQTHWQQDVSICSSLYISSTDCQILQLVPSTFPASCVFPFLHSYVPHPAATALV